MRETNNIKTYFYWLDLIRFFAAFLVVLDHYRGAFFVEFGLLSSIQQTPLIAVFYSFTRLGQEAVLIFFVMSGYLVGGQALLRLKNDTFLIGDYAIDRTVRIMLPLISALILIFFINLIIGVKTDPVTWWGNLFSLQGVFVKPISDPLWSLSYEVWFYILIGGIALLKSKKSELRNLAFGILFLCILVFTKLNPINLFIWFIGVFAIFIKPSNTNWLRITIQILFLLFFLATLQITKGSRSIENPLLLFLLPKREVLEICFAFCFSYLLINITCIIPIHKHLIRLNNWGTKLAAFSYTLYLTHFPVLHALQYFGVPKSEIISIKSISFFLFELAISLIVSWLIYSIFEKRTKWVKQWIKIRFNISSKPRNLATN